jgi:hypothetical protein
MDNLLKKGVPHLRHCGWEVWHTYTFFKEKLSAINWLGIALSLGAIALIAYG